MPDSQSSKNMLNGRQMLDGLSGSMAQKCGMKISHFGVYSFGKNISFWCQNDRVSYGVATISRLLKIIGLFCKRTL